MQKKSVAGFREHKTFARKEKSCCSTSPLPSDAGLSEGGLCLLRLVCFFSTLSVGPMKTYHPSLQSFSHWTYCSCFHPTDSDHAPAFFQ